MYVLVCVCMCERILQNSIGKYLQQQTNSLHYKLQQAWQYMVVLALASFSTLAGWLAGDTVDWGIRLMRKCLACNFLKAYF